MPIATRKRRPTAPPAIDLVTAALDRGRGPLSVSEMATDTELSRAEVNAALAALVRDGHVTRRLVDDLGYIIARWALRGFGPAAPASLASAAA